MNAKTIAIIGVCVALLSAYIAYLAWPANYPSVEHLEEVARQREAACRAAAEAGAPSPLGNGCDSYQGLGR